MTATVAERKERAALMSIAASGCITLGKLVAGLLSGSLALLSEAGHGLLDTGSTTLTYFAIRAAGRPADEEHQYGHGKIEAVTALVETGLLFMLALVVLAVGIRRLVVGSTPVEANGLAFAVLVVSIVVDAVRWRALARIARETRSDALAADALHFSSDLVASVLVLIGLLASRYGFVQGDTVAAIGVALFIGIAGYRLGRRTVDTLVDTAPRGLSAKLRHVVEAVPGVVSVEQLRLRPAGAEVLGELSISVSRTLPLERVRALKDQVVAAMAAEVADASVTVTANPTVLDDETLLEKVLLTSAKHRLPVHHVTIQEVDGRKCVSLDVEVDGTMRHAEAHEIASALESAIADEIGPGIEVETHIEPLAVAELAGQDAGARIGGEIAAGLARRAAETGAIHDVHSVRTRRNAAGLMVNYHCHVDAALTVDEVHDAVDHLDRTVRGDFPSIVRIVGHAEPFGRH